MRKYMTEDELKSTVIELAKYRGWKVTHFRPALNRRGQWRTPLEGDAGFVDLVLARRGEVIHAELKTETGVLSKGQREWSEALGDTYRLWRPSDLDQIAKELK